MAIRRRVQRIAVLGVSVLAALGWWRHRRLVAPVGRELRSPVLWLPVAITGDVRLKVVRALLGRFSMPKPPPGMTVETRHADGSDGGRVRMLVHEPVGRSRPSGALLWIHGGGFIIGIPEQSAAICNRLAHELDVVVVNVDYRLAPEHPFPAGLDDCVDALRWIHDHAGELGIDPSRVAVGGDSAGGGLAAAVCQRALDAGDLPLALQVLMYPMLDDRTGLRVDDAGRGELVWTADANRYGWTAYLGHPPRAAEEGVCVAPARRADLAGLPPAWIGVGDLDLFYEEDVEYAGRLEAAGVPCELHVVAGMYHGADNFAAKAASMVDFHARLSTALRDAIGSDRAVAP